MITTLKRGLEQGYYDYYKENGAKIRNKIKPISDRNMKKNDQKYIDAAKNNLAKKAEAGRPGNSGIETCKSPSKSNKK